MHKLHNNYNISIHEMEESSEDFYAHKEDKEKDDDFSL